MSFASILIGISLSLAVCLGLFPLRSTPLGAFFLGRGITQPITLAIAISVANFCLMRLSISTRERKLLGRDWIPHGMVNVRPDDEAIQVILRVISTPKTLIGNRLGRVLVCFRDSGSRAIARELHEDDVALTQAEIEEGFLVTRTMIWVLPMLGFLGTVLGISVSIGGFSGLLTNVTDIAKVKAGLTQVTGGLSTAFDTTLLGIVCAIACMVLMSLAEKSEFRLAAGLESSITDTLLPRLGQYEKKAT
ncbi:MotA/TolQ/ExbB proton channel family protein [Cyanobium sp. NIES-981]|uniref:MotA/TolQ/ExbB proton channel family protein n=1 Tax=Cyanobium sp. NIES-981 TaxID=1851505 RepID=UPI0012F8811E|nr:MotA/TolQ/ExbB proton channel family protein [Cyanobium sp. NIES-981]